MWELHYLWNEGSITKISIFIYIWSNLSLVHIDKLELHPFLSQMVHFLYTTWSYILSVFAIKNLSFHFVPSIKFQVQQEKNVLVSKQYVSHLMKKDNKEENK